MSLLSRSSYSLQQLSLNDYCSSLTEILQTMPSPELCISLSARHCHSSHDYNLLENLEYILRDLPDLKHLEFRCSVNNRIAADTLTCSLIQLCIAVELWISRVAARPLCSLQVSFSTSLPSPGVLDELRGLRHIGVNIIVDTETSETLKQTM